jgi:hypothetical protein
MCKTIRIAFVTIALNAFVSNMGLAQINDTNTLMFPLYNQIEHQIVMLETYSLAESVKQLDDSIDSLETMRFSNRKENAGIWIEILSMIDNNLDTNFDITAPNVAWYVTPPPDGKNGYQYQPGTPPEVLKDPQSRSNYEVAILENKQRKKQLALQVALFHLNKRVNSGFEKFLKSSYTSSETDKKEIGEMLGKATLSPARKEKIKIILGFSSEVPPNK